MASYEPIPQRAYLRYLSPTILVTFAAYRASRALHTLFEYLFALFRQSKTPKVHRLAEL